MIDSSAISSMRLTGAAFRETVPNGVIARGRRTTSTGNITTTETGVLRLDSIPVYAGRGYEISASCILMDASVADDVGSSRFRISTSGSATTSSTQIGELRDQIGNANAGAILPFVVFYFPSSDATLSVLLTTVRHAGTGNILIIPTSNNPLDLIVKDMGVTPADSGVVI